MFMTYEQQKVYEAQCQRDAEIAAQREVAALESKALQLSERFARLKDETTGLTEESISKRIAAARKV